MWSNTNMDDIHAKIIALLELSKNNPSEHEAARAAEMARKMMLKWNIQEGELKLRSPVNYSDPHELDRDYLKILGWMVQKSTGTTFVYYRDESFRIVGRTVNVQVANSLLKFLSDQVEHLYKTFLPRGMSKAERAKYRKDFKRNCAMRIYHRSLEEIKTSTGTDLVLIQSELEKEVEAFLHNEDIRIVTSKMKVSSGTRGAIDGQNAGNIARLQQVIR